MTSLRQQPKKSPINFAGGGNCIYSALVNETDTIDIQYGMLWINDGGKYSGKKGFDSSFSFHLWNLDEETETIYDDFDNIIRSLDVCEFDSKHPSQWKVKLVDGTNFTKSGPCNKVADDYRKMFDKIYKAYDAIYVYNFAFDCNPSMPGLYTKKLNWDDVDSKIELAEEFIKNNSNNAWI